MTCREIEDRVALYAGGDLDAESARDVERHVDACPACRGMLADVREQRETMAEWCDTEPTEDALRAVREGVLAGIARGDARRGFFDRIRFAPFRPVAWGLGGLAAAAVLVLAVWASVSQTSDVQLARSAAALPDRPDARAVAVPAPGAESQAAVMPTPEPVPVPARPRRDATRLGAAEVSMASDSRDVAGDARTAAAMSDAPPGPVRRIEIQTADPNIRIIWLVQEPGPDPNRSGAAGR